MPNQYDPSKPFVASRHLTQEDSAKLRESVTPVTLEGLGMPPEDIAALRGQIAAEGGQEPTFWFTDEASGQDWLVRLVPVGAFYGRFQNGAYACTNDGKEALVEFFDPHGRDGGGNPLGFFVSRYRVSTLMELTDGVMIAAPGEMSQGKQGSIQYDSVQRVQQWLSAMGAADMPDASAEPGVTGSAPDPA